MSEDLNEDGAGSGSAACAFHRARQPVYIALAWLASAVGVLYLADIPYDFDESVCGVWGCFPPIQALAAMHLLWGILFGATIWAICRWRPVLLKPVGAAMLIAGLAGISFLVGIDLAQWLEWASSEYRHLWHKRVGYILAISTDRPVVQSLIAGIVCLVLGSKSRVVLLRVTNTPENSDHVKPVSNNGSNQGSTQMGKNDERNTEQCEGLPN